MPPEKQI